MRSWKYWGIGILAVIVVLAGSFLIWALNPSEPADIALAALEPSPEIEVLSEPWLIFAPKAAVPETGFIFYPGGHVDYRAYAPPARAIAEEGYLVVVVPMPLSLAFLGANQADDVMSAFPQIQDWVLGGHSLGGAMAARYVYDNPGTVSGLVLWAAYPADNNDLAGRASLEVTSIYATRDGLATGDKIAASRPLLPPDTMWVAIYGGNHAQFGDYGPQNRDNPATVSFTAQQKQIVEATVAVLE
ncbi:MAG: alpha/beta hydrolase [Anaerolineae bacterium]|nr:alpha/beta hydrolase [Anaerolineae bacterium]